MRGIICDLIFAAITASVLGVVAFEMFLARICEQHGGRFELLNKCRAANGNSHYTDFYWLLNSADIFYLVVGWIAVFGVTYYFKSCLRKR
jgi:hypothetical protein